jgi:hypothetical protein
MITDDDLLLYNYRDGLEPAERARIGAALSEQPELAQRMHHLVSRLDAAAAIPEVPVPVEVQQRWKAALAQAAERQTTEAPRVAPRPAAVPRWLAAAAVLIIAIVSIFSHTRQPPSNRIVEVPTTNAASGTGGSAYERGLKTHLESTEQQLASLESATPEDRERLLKTIIEQNRIYALAAERAGEPQLARVLRAFSPVLEGLNTEDGDPSASVAQLAFEFRVMQGRLAAGTASTTRSTTL